MADHPLRPATDHSLGQPLPNQLANRTQAAHQAPSQALAHRRHAVLAPVSQGCPPPNDTSLRDTHPSATNAPESTPVRLACVKHAASVRSEPGSNSQVHRATAPAPHHKDKTAKHHNTRTKDHACPNRQTQAIQNNLYIRNMQQQSQTTQTTSAQATQSLNPAQT